MLALLAELGIKANTNVQVFAGAGTVADLVLDCRANFRLDGENEWSAIALALYVPTGKTWVNRFGERISFDGIARNLMERDLSSASCNGAHVLMALSVFSQLSRQTLLLSDSTRRQVDAYLDLALKAIISSQRENGALNGMWYLEFVKMAGMRQYLSFIDDEKGVDRNHVVDQTQSHIGDVLATGHHCEWIITLPKDRQPSSDFYEGCISFLEAAISSVGCDDLRRDFCPYSHAVRVLLAVSE